MIKTLNFKAEFIVARKKIDIFRRRHNNNEDIFYNEIITRLFERKLHKQNNVIFFQNVAINLSNIILHLLQLLIL